ncbi:MAG: ECF transporter S component [Clostridia bacterium]|nr:ECF transporter S component [Clostridia bacterium]
MHNRTKKVTFTALFSAIAFLCVFIFRFSGIGGFLTFDAKDAVLALCGLFFGPAYGIAATLIVTLLEAVTVSGTGLWGFVMNLLSSGTFVLVSSLIYTNYRTFRGAITSLVAGVAATTLVMLPANLLITPVYMHIERAEVVALLLPLLLPFNLVKSTCSTALVLLLYKPISSAMKQFNILPGRADTYRLNRRTVLVIIASVALLAVSVCLIIFCLGGEFQIFRR